MKKPKNQTPDDAPAAGEVESPIQTESESTEGVEILTEEQAAFRMAGGAEGENSTEAIEEEPEPEADPKDQLAELEAIFEKLPKKLIQLRDLEALKAKYQQEIEDFKIDLLAPDAERRVSIRRSRENLIDMIDMDMLTIINSPDPEKARARILVNELTQCVRRAVNRDISLLCDEVRAFAKANPAVAYLFDNTEFKDDQIRNLPIFFRALRTTALSDNFNSYWIQWSAERLEEEVPKFMELIRRAVSGERILVLPEAA